MEKLFYPESIVIFGLSSKQNNIPRITLENMLRWGYRGRIFGVNPRSEDPHVDGIKMYRDLVDLPEVPDLAYCLIPARFVPEVVDQCGRMGIRRMAISSGGFSEFGEEGRMLSEKTLSAARCHGIRFVGPNGVTVANTANGLCLPFVPLHKAPEGGMSVISQSGGVALMLFNFLVDENIGMAKFASIGNKLDLDEVDFLEYFISDPDTKIICLYLESINRGRRFLEVASRSQKPIVVLKSNTTNAGKKAAMSHTAALSNDDAIIDTAFDRAGVIRIGNYHDFLAVVKAFQLPPMRGRRVMVMSPAGGFSVITADLCEKAGFQFADPGQDFYDGLQEFTNAGVIHFSNPLDMGDIYDPQLSAHVITSVMHSDKVDGVLYVGQRPQMPAGENVFYRMFLTDMSKEAWGTILSSGKPLGVCLFGPSRMILQTKRTVNFPVFNSAEEMVRAMAAQMRFHERMARPPMEELVPGGMHMRKARKWMQGRVGDYGEEAMELLDHFGVPVPRSQVAQDAGQAVQYAGKVGYPVVMKVVSPEAIHKSDAGGVLLGIRGPEQAKEAFRTIRNNLSSYNKKARFVGVRISAMAKDGLDMFIGAKQDPSFGPVVFFGMGGVFIELFRDVAIALCPTSHDEVVKKILQLRSSAMLKGYRGTGPSDTDAFVDAVVRVSHLMQKFPQIEEMDINPVRVFPKGQGILALDSRMRIGMVKE
ncbi:MAG TPA: acetate--CoA ligase family protein [Deltaproteobacteria bacterium]|nr:acetate--CoA ligase family protein [Deltaproteobacteria bacterium]